MAGREEVQLLLLLKGTVEGLLVSQVANLWSIYGGLNRLHCAMERIFKHGFRVFNQEGEPDLWIFINGLSWLQPNLATSPSMVLESCHESQHIPPHITNDKALMWIYKSLETHSLSQKLSWLLSDQEHLLSCYEKKAFLSQEEFGEAALICLRAVEHNQPSLLTEINPRLYMTKWDTKVYKTHRRCSSFPETLERSTLWTSSLGKGAHKGTMGIIESHCDEGQEPEVMQAVEVCEKKEGSPALEKTNEPEIVPSLIDTPVADVENNTSEAVLDVMVPKKENVKTCLDKVKAWNSLPSLLGIGFEGDPRERSLTVSTKPWLLNRSFSSRHGNKRCGSQTMPSTPFRSTKRIHLTPTRSATEDSRLSDGLNQISARSKISPSVLHVDYTGLQYSDSSDAISKSGKMIQIKRSTSNVAPTVIKRSLKNGSSNKPPSQNTVKQLLNDVVLQHVDKEVKELEETTSKEVPCPNRVWKDMDNEIKSLSGKPAITPVTPVKGRSRKLSDAYSKRKPGSAPNFTEWTRENNSSCLLSPVTPSRKSFMEDGGSSVQPMSTGFFPRPIEGQSLTSFLSSGQFSRANAELDRENAHFSISEAMIAAIEQIKCNKELQTTTEIDDVGDESDEEIIHLKQRLRLRRQQRQVEQRRLMWGVTLLSDGKTDTTTTDQSISPLSTSPGTSSDSLSTDGVEDVELDEAQNIAALKDLGLSMSMASLYSEAELSKHTPARGAEVTITECFLSAESVALSLIRQFSEKQLPRASDLKWLVSEQEAPQQLLPLPKSWPVSPDEAEDDMRQATPLRGNMDWAPPRPQIIFTVHPSPVRRVLMAKQNYRCAGCGMKVEPAYAHRFRYCEYIGRYFCTGCHSNQTALIPGRVLTKWDFTRCPVSSFSYRLLDQMFLDPLFSVADHNVGLYRKSRALERCRQFRLQLFYIKDFLQMCRFAIEVQEVLKREPPHIINEIEVYSMHDFVEIKQGDLPSRLRELVAFGTEHTSQCQLCLARGFVCELCHSKEIIFPWQLARVSRCSACGACYHIRCRPPVPCPRCKRISARQTNQNNAPLENDAEATASSS